MNRRHKLASSLRQPVPSWAFLLVVIGLVTSMLFGYFSIDGNTKDLKSLITTNSAKSEKRDTQFCDIAHFFQDIKVFVPVKYVPLVAADIVKFLLDINTDKTECHPKTPPKKAERPKPHPSNSANAPVPQVTITRTVVTPEGTRTVIVTPTSKPPKTQKHHKPKKSKTIFCMLPTPISPIPPIGGC